MTWPVLLLIAPGLPLALAAAAIAPAVRRILPGALPFAPLPALAAALFAPAGAEAPLPDVLLGAALALDGPGRVFLGVTAALWSLAGVYALGYMARRGLGWFCTFWLATLAGNLGTFLAADAVSFYLSFSLLSLAAYGLVAHAGTGEARRAGRIYIILSVVGETALLMGLLVAATSADSLMIADIRPALAGAPHRDLALALLVAGLGVKAGLMPLHVWLPLAHSAAPTPASAVLSGAIVKAGVFGLIQFLPLHATAPGWSSGLVAAGLATAYLGVIFGLAQTRVKTVLAYSTLSQMGLVVVVTASALAEPGPGAAAVAVAVALYAAHHALAKGALFLAVGLVPAAKAALRKVLLVLTGFAALAVAGLPLSGGAAAKLAVKGPLGDATAGALVTISAVGTTLLMLRFLALLGREPASGPHDPGGDGPPLSMILPFVILVLAATATPWLLLLQLTDHHLAYAVEGANLWAAAWPLLLGLAAWALARRRLPPAVAVPAGDLVVLAEAGAVRAAVLWRALAPRLAFRRPKPVKAGLADALAEVEGALARWPTAAAALLAAILAAFGLLLA